MRLCGNSLKVYFNFLEKFKDFRLYFLDSSLYDYQKQKIISII